MAQSIKQQLRQARDCLQDAIAIIAALDDPDCESWLGQARALVNQLHQEGSE
jgi:hypothetical protein